jgi:hypothetical protein
MSNTKKLTNKGKRKVVKFDPIQLHPMAVTPVNKITYNLGGNLDPNTLYQELSQSSTDPLASSLNSLGTTAANMAMPGLGTAISTVQNIAPELVRGKNQSQNLQRSSTVEGFVNPIKTAGKVLSSSDLSVGQKALGLLAAPIGGHMVGKAASEKFDKEVAMDARRQDFGPILSELPNQFALGGNLGEENVQTNPSGQALEYNEYNGNTHAEGGIAVGPNAEVEDGEVRVEDYIFSNQLKNPFSGKTFADEAKAIKKKYEGRGDYDAPSNRALEKELSRLMQANEIAREYEEARQQASEAEVENEINQSLSEANIGNEVMPQEIEMQEMAMQQQEGQKVDPMVQPPVEEFANGGRIKYPVGGPIDDETIKKRLEDRKHIAAYLKKAGQADPTKTMSTISRTPLDKSSPEYQQYLRRELSNLTSGNMVVDNREVDVRDYNDIISRSGIDFYAGAEGTNDYNAVYKIDDSIIKDIRAFENAKLDSESSVDPRKLVQNVPGSSQEIVGIPQMLPDGTHYEAKRVRQTGPQTVFDPSTGSMVQKKELGGFLENIDEEDPGKLSGTREVPDKFKGKFAHRTPTEVINPDGSVSYEPYFYMTTGDRLKNFTEHFKNKNNKTSENEKIRDQFALGGFNTDPNLKDIIVDNLPIHTLNQLPTKDYGTDLVPIKNLEVGTSKKESKSFLENPENLGLLASNLGPAFNLAQASNVETSKLPRIPDLERVDMSDARLAAERQSAKERANLSKSIRQTSPGSAGQVLATQAAGTASIADKEINNFLQLYGMEQNANVQMENQRRQANAQIAMQEAIQNEQNRAMSKSVQGMALTDMGINTQGFIKDKALKQENEIQNRETLNLINQLFPHYEFLPEDEKAKIRNFVIQYKSPAGEAPQLPKMVSPKK